MKNVYFLLISPNKDETGPKMMFSRNKTKIDLLVFPKYLESGPDI